MSVDQELQAPGDTERVAYAVDLVTSRRPADGARVLDLGARTGAFSAAFAELGAKVTAVEGRQENLDRIPAHPNIKSRLGDVRKLDARGRYDIALCLGILYHLEAHDAVQLLRTLRRLVVTDGLVVIDTHVSRRSNTVQVDGKTYSGHWYTEWPGWWSAIDNERSWWFTADSLRQACRDAGWANVEELPDVVYPGAPQGRVWLVLS